MLTEMKKLLTITAVLAALVAGPAIHAYADTPSSQSQAGMMGQGGMMQGGQMSPGMMGQGGMMGMMEQMSQMMATCNQMMESKMKGHDTPLPGGESPDGAQGKKHEG